MHKQSTISHQEGVTAESGTAAAVSRLTRKHRRPVLAGWVIALLLASFGALSIGDVLSGGGWAVAGSQSQRAAEELAEAKMLGRGQVSVTLVVHDQKLTADDPGFETRVREVADAVEQDPALRVSGSYGWATLSPGSRAPFLGEDGRTAITSFGLAMDDGAARREMPAVNDRLTQRFDQRGLEITLVGDAPFWGEVNQLSRQGLIWAEIITLPLIAVILLLLYRSVVAAATSLVVGITAIVFTLGALSPLAHHTELSIFLENAATMLGFGISVDYSLFVISRFQEELRGGRSVHDAVTRALRYAGHTVLFSGLTVIATMSTLFVVDLNIIWSIALGAITVVAFSVLASTVVLPALLHVLGHRINKGRLPFLSGSGLGSDSSTRKTGRWHRFALAVMRRPVVIGLTGAVVLCFLALPAGGLRMFTPDARIVPQSSPVRTGYDHIQQQFGSGTTSPVQVVVRTPGLSEPGARSDLIALHDSLTELPGVSRTQSLVTTLRRISPERPLNALQPSVRERMPDDARQSLRHFLSDDGRTTVIELIPNGPASDESTIDLVHAAQRTVASAQYPGFHVMVGGETAEGLVANEVIQDGLPWVIALMLIVVFTLLLITFRSVLLPLKAVAMNLLSLAATYGILVAVFQHGVGTRLLGLNETGYLQNFVPILLLALLFSLNTDYEVFLLNRIRENHVQTRDNRAAVATGLQSTAPLISGAAVLMVAVFGAFAFTGMVPIEQLGFGMALAILIDATIVRLILVPATMRLMGSWNWWLPGRRSGGSTAVEEKEMIRSRVP
ncbi:RND superfamily putative drug exporter [Saccharopolyspora lacisalsi]|uniref:RND superfamily putative drug exporter n=1 Tax=Halosaccharopolyspora lacisalsi TaxID=1000566 RepID=A0A839E6V3_9PSEU|nr:MMPL family transporter [Halosaccharopolyspora lacisalsi]MBA8826608.1 RND superfamily putative drug exporter [Halosaccharopolyspora lacisalsi]